MNLLDEIEANIDHDLRLIVKNNKKYLRCKFCDWKTLAWRTTKDGKRVNGYRKLQDHMMKEHEDEYVRILQRVNLNGRPSNSIGY